MSLLTRSPAETTEEVDLPDERPIPGYVRVNLLPDSLRERERIRRAKRIAAILVALALVVVGVLWFMAQQQIRSAQDDLTAAQAEGAQLQQQMAQYADVPLVFAQAETAQAALSTAMSREIRWSFLLNQLSFATPPGVTLTSIQGTMADGGTTQTSPGGVLPVKESVGTMTFGGTADSFSNVASWLDSLETLKDYTYPFLTNSTKDDVSGVNRITWESTADLSTNALSGRYGTPPPATSTAPSGGGGTTQNPAPTPNPAPSSDGAQTGPTS